MGIKRIVHKWRNPDNTRITIVVLLACAALFLGRSFQHLFHDIPIRTILWNQELMEPVVTGMFGIEWEEYISSPEWDQRIQGLVHMLGVFYLVCFILSVRLFFRTDNRFAAIFPVASLFLLALSYLYYLDRFHRIGELMEFACQVVAPIALYLVLRQYERFRLLTLLRLGVALTFVGHGLYATGFYPLPGPFMDMVIIGFGVSQDTAMTILNVAGWIDLLVSVLIFVPYTDRYAAIYATGWGGATALARIWTNFDGNLAEASIAQWIPEVLVRMPNMFIPLAGFFLLHSSAAVRSR